MNFMVAIFAGLGVGAWVYSKIMRNTGGNTMSAMVVAGSSGAVALFLMLFILSKIG